MYGKVRLQGVYPGIDLVYYGHQGQLEYDFVVAPGADASSIRWGFDGAKPELAANGDLLLPVEGASDQIRLNKPVVYQMKDGVRQPVDGSFAIAKNGQASFKLGAYDRSRELVIDPTLTFLGRSAPAADGATVANAMAVRFQSGEIILTGVTQDSNFPVTKGALQTTCNTDAPADNDHALHCAATIARPAQGLSPRSARMAHRWCTPPTCTDSAGTSMARPSPWIQPGTPSSWARLLRTTFPSPQQHNACIVVQPAAGISVPLRALLQRNIHRSDL